jgi:hypothetical protein
MFMVIALALVVRSAGATTVTNLDDSGTGSLREAVAATPPGGVVDFAPGLTGTITLTSPIDVNGLTITGPGASALTISGGNATRQLSMSGATTLEGVTIADGVATETVKGAITYVLDSGPHVLRDCRVENNASSGTAGGAVVAFSDLTVERCTFSNNVGTASSVGALELAAVTTHAVGFVVRDSVFTANQAASGGGGIGALAAQSATATVSVLRSTFSANRGSGGSAIAVATADTATVHTTLANVTVVGHPTEVSQLAVSSLATAGSTASLDIVNSTIHQPGSTSTPLGVVLAGVATVTNSIVSGGALACAATQGGTVVNGGHNLATDDTCGFGAGGDGVDPKLDPAGLADHGGSTQTIALLDDSPARDAGDDAVCAAPPVDGVDQRGTARPIGTHCDIGAFEAPLVPTTTTTTLPPAGCPEEVTVAATGCRIDALRTMVGEVVPAGALQTKLNRFVGIARDKLDASEGFRAAGKTKQARASLAKARAAIGRFRKAIKSKLAAKGLTADQRSQLAAAASRLLRDLRFLKG